MKTKQCSICEIVKPLNEFAKRKNRKSGLYCYCKKCACKAKTKWKRDNPEKDILCRRKSMLKRRYGVTLEQYDRMLEEQNGVCAICGGVNKGGWRLAVDHDHDTGKVRGLLCQNCNRRVGELENNPTLFRSTINYLSRSLTSE